MAEPSWYSQRRTATICGTIVAGGLVAYIMHHYLGQLNQEQQQKAAKIRQLAKIGKYTTKLEQRISHADSEVSALTSTKAHTHIDHSIMKSHQVEFVAFV